jgi:Immunity protein 8
MDVILSGLEFDPDPRSLSSDPAAFVTHLTILVGTPPDGGGEMFSATLCTPEWIAAQEDSSRLLSGHGLLVVRFEEFSESKVRDEVERFLARIHEDSWSQVATRIKNWFPRWEFD